MKITFNHQFFKKELAVAVTVPTFSDGIELAVCDYDRGGGDDTLATAFISFNETFQLAKEAKSNQDHTAYGKPYWINLYAAPKGADGDLAKQMNCGECITFINSFSFFKM